MKRDQGLQQVKQTRLIAIARGVKPEQMVDAAEALLQGGVTVLEVTLNTPDALLMIQDLQQQLGDKMYIGAGTVLDPDDAQAAMRAGASFLVTPNTDEDVIRYAAREGVPIFPGAMTPTEIVRAWKAGATAIKIFPSSGLGLPYIQELMGPLNQIPMIAVGGINENNVGEYLNAGCYAVGVGGSLIHLKEIDNGNYTWLTEKASRLTRQIQAAVNVVNGERSE
ncbi:bifunctional 4-hydroxy-2-oxoglutarate aldolase/2-dehydro-3-deoxy-phosphogluconate aldolase [Paenibacillus sp. J2TS4]|uniref:bifunctional 4-hydroxy-2-oxoglutarate aldolase/2-dehydro-3-deoxy-phosphogluconate aldolase n=1 Tax=Paenibacillus sp. J2TS4 TaxID=2807194 RepID=UPI001B18D0D0|nr:bifunctional 4-hydroxy-2-oxoglutarate aldolase/2-dehydro-3-deoxy-phosphogluconate aldolase [Paenibacillus sp. J2TS4]GIP33786.1 2-dehydro-3-deoxy-phosphogluconate aldolase [Paenibacillus sp. J2TS4]